MPARMFVALRPSAEAAEHLADFLEPRRDAGPPGLRWSDPEQVHVTLAFLPAVADRVVDGLVEALAGAAARRRTFVAALSGAGAFPDVLAARVLYAGVALAGADPPGPREARDPSEPPDRAELEALARGLRSAAGHAGTEVEGQRFRPHATVARLARPASVVRLAGVLDTYSGPRFTVDRVVLVSSHLGEGPRGRPRHETVAELPLG